MLGGSCAAAVVEVGRLCTCLLSLLSCKGQHSLNSLPAVSGPRVATCNLPLHSCCEPCREALVAVQSTTSTARRVHVCLAGQGTVCCSSAPAQTALAPCAGVGACHGGCSSGSEARRGAAAARHAHIPGVQQGRWSCAAAAGCMLGGWWDSRCCWFKVEYAQHGTAMLVDAQVGAVHLPSSSFPAVLLHAAGAASSSGLPRVLR